MNVSRMARNATANIAKLGVSILATLIMPHLLLDTLSTEGYSVWVLIIQIGMYSSLLNLGITTVVGRFVAYSIETGDIEGKNRIISSGLAILLAFAALAIGGMAIAASSISQIFPDIPVDMLPETAITMFLVGSVIALRLPANIMPAIFIGMQRNEFPMIFLLIEKLFTILFVFIVAQIGGTLFQVGIAYALALATTFILELILFRRHASQVQISPAFVNQATVAEIFRNTAALAIWSFSGLLISGMDLVIVGAFDFQAVAAFSFAATLTIVVAQVQSAAVSVIMPVAATLAGRHDERRITSLLVRSTRYGVLALYLAGLPLMASGALIISLWVGSEFVEKATPILVVMVTATIIRQSSLTFTITALGVGRQNKVIAPPLVGGVVNLMVSVPATIQFGAIGAALGTVIGGMIEITMHILYGVPRVPELLIKPGEYFRDGFLQPTICALPAIVVTAAWMIWGDPVHHPVLSLLISALLAVIMLLAFWFFVAVKEDRQRALEMLCRLQTRFGLGNATLG